MTAVEELKAEGDRQAGGLKTKHHRATCRSDALGMKVGGGNKTDAGAVFEARVARTLSANGNKHISEAESKNGKRAERKNGMAGLGWAWLIRGEPSQDEGRRKDEV